MSGKGIAAMCAVVVALMVVFGYFAIKDHNEWEAWCKSQGGHVVDHTDVNTVVVVGGNGKPGVGTSTNSTSYCLTADGRILDVR